MAAINTPVGTADTDTLMDDWALNPPLTNTKRTVVHCTLVFDGMDFVPYDLYDALNAEYVDVAYEKNVPSRNCFIFNISGGLT